MADYERTPKVENKKAKENFPFASFPFIERIIFVQQSPRAVRTG
jgi:hypothetical protein